MTDYVERVYSLATLRRTRPTMHRQVIVLQGTATAGDGGAGVFVWDPLSIVPDDGSTTIALTTLSDAGLPGRWVRESGVGTIPALRGTLAALPLASLWPVGTMYFCTDARLCKFMCDLHPTDPTKRLWRSLGNVHTRFATSNGATQSNRFAVYDAGSGLVTMATSVGQMCNCTTSTAGSGGLPVTAVIFNVSGMFLTVGASDLNYGDEFMTDASGLAIPFVPGSGHVALGMMPSSIKAGQSCVFEFYNPGGAYPPTPV